LAVGVAASAIAARAEGIATALPSVGFALIMLWYELAEDPDYDEDGERTATSVLLISGGDTGFNRGRRGPISRHDKLSWEQGAR